MATNASKIKISVQSQPPRVVRWGYHTGSKGTKKALSLMIGIAGDGSVCRVSFAEGKTAPQLLREWERAWPETAFVEDKAATADAAKKIFSGGSAPLLLTGTKFQQSVWKELARIASGKTVSYADIARRIGNPKAMRAVGTACGANPVPLLIPCHRVVGSNGGLGGFTSGLAMKKILLRAEGVDPESLAA